MRHAVLHCWGGTGNLFAAGFPEHVTAEYDLVNIAKIGFKDIRRNTFASDYFGSTLARATDAWHSTTSGVRATGHARTHHDPVGSSGRGRQNRRLNQQMQWPTYLRLHLQHMHCPEAWGGDEGVLALYDLMRRVVRTLLTHDLIDDDRSDGACVRGELNPSGRRGHCTTSKL